MIDRGKSASSLFFLLSKITKPEQTNQLELVKILTRTKKWYDKKRKTILVTLYKKLLTFRDTDKKFELGEIFWKWSLIKTIK